MFRFYFHLEMCGRVYPDEEGRSLSDLEQARASAILDARDLMAAEVKAGWLCLACRIDIADGGGAVILSVPFHEAIDFSGPDRTCEHQVLSASTADE